MSRRDVFRDDVPTEGLEDRGPHGRLILRVVGEGHVETRPLPATGEVLLGRGDNVDVLIADPSVSRRHASLQLGPRITITDLGSRHGTRVRGREVTANQPTPVAIGEPIEIGSVVVVVHAQPTVPVKPAVSGPLVVDDVMRDLHELVERFAAGDISVLLLGETGVGKEITAELIHARSPRAKKPLVRLNCAAFSESLLESELFGHERGAFTGAVTAKPGMFEVAQGGTVFLDEAGELPPATQVKLLRLLEERKVTRVGGTKSIAIDVRFVSATNRDLDAEIAAGRFRQDLFFRLAGATLSIPPLRERPAEIEPLALRFAAEFAARAGQQPPAILPEALQILRRYAWPGNIRELRNLMERAVLLAGGGSIAPSHFPIDKMAAARPGVPAPGKAAPVATRVDPAGKDEATIEPELWNEIDVLKKQRILDALAACGGNQSRAAKMLGIGRNTLAAKLEEYGFPRPRKKPPA